MQNLNETRVLTNNPAYKISINGSVYKIADNTEVNTMKKPDSRGLARVKLYRDGKSYKATVQDLLLSVFTHEEIQGDDKTVSDTNETDDMSEDDTEFFPYQDKTEYIVDDKLIARHEPQPDNRKYWVDDVLIAVNEKLVVDYLSYLPLPLYKNPCYTYMTEKEEDNYNYQRDRYIHADVYKYI